ncbi:MAG: heat-inducible transcriptional repressor HrcA [Pseudobutyrivibrio sp.]|nr:heat-inducible transcriptional repressor HrcA [Pseudobutyrivibrio sp.]
MADIELDERKIKILNAVIKNYLETGEPVGSRTISKYTDLNLSSATIRNEMSDLEDLGYIVQPHTSAGRIPSDKGYRFYVNNLIASKDQEVADMKNWMLEKTEKMESLLQNVAKVLATNTQYATVISAPSIVGKRVKFIQLSAVDENHLLSVAVLDGNMVKNRMIEIDKPLDNETMLKLNMLLNTNLNGLAIDQINLAVITKLKEQAGIHDEIIEQVLNTVADSIKEGEDLQVYTSGTTNIFKYPELSDSRRASELLTTFEDKEDLVEFLSDSETKDIDGIQVYIGEETPIDTMKDCSVVTATYELGDGVKGTIGIVGPKRMDYENVVDNIKSLKGQLDKLLKKSEGKEIKDSN